MSSLQIGRRTFLGTAASATGIAALGGKAFAQLALPKAPVTLNVIDIAGDLSLRQKAFENYRKAKPNLVSRITFSKGPAPELPGKIKAQQDANHLDLDLVLAGYDGLVSGFDLNLWVELLPTYAYALPPLDKIYLEGARRIQEQTRGQGVVMSYSPYGPLLEYMPDRVKGVPSTADEFLAWAKENKNRFMYARPANSGPGRAFIAGLPYILGDSNPRDPTKGWDKTWAYLQALGENIEYYPAGTGETLKQLSEGSRDMIASTTGWDIHPRILGIVPKEAKIATLKGFHWGSDAHCMCIPKGLSSEKLAVLLDLMSFMLSPEQQAYSYDGGDFYPGPAVKGVTLDMASPDTQAALKEFGRPEYEQLIASNPVETPLDPDQMVLAFRRWDEQIGGSKHK